LKRVRLLTIVFILKIAVFALWFAMSFDFSGSGIVYAEQPVIGDVVVTDGVKVVDIEGGEVSVDDSGGIEVSTDSLVTETERSMLKAMKRRENELNDREEDLKKYERRLTLINDELDLRMKELKATKSVVDKAMARLKSAEKMRTQRIVKIYESMAPEEAAARMEKLDEKTAVMILSRMKEKKAGSVLGLVSIKKAVKFSQMMNKPLINKKKRR